jgi:endoplasmic reticulum chaperone BiP
MSRKRERKALPSSGSSFRHSISWNSKSIQPTNIKYVAIFSQTSKPGIPVGPPGAVPPTNFRKLGRFDLTGIAPAPRGVPQIEVTFKVHENGILHVTAADKAAPGRARSVTIANDRGRLSQEEIDRMVREAEEDRRVRDRVDACNRLENYVYRVRSALKDGGGVGGTIGEDEPVCGPIIKQAYEKSGAGADGEADDDDVNEL